MQKKICNPTFCESKRYLHTGHQNVCCWPCMLWHLPWQTWLQQDTTLLNASIVNVSELMIEIFDVFDPSLYSWRHYALLRSSSGMLSLLFLSRPAKFINMKSFWHGLKFHIFTTSSWTILTNPSKHSMLCIFLLPFSSLKRMMTARYELSASNYVCIHVGVMHTCGIKG